jgi:hypothetical protein
MPVSRKQTHKIIVRARQKNKKIIGKLKELKERRSALKKTMNGSEFGNNIMTGSRYSKVNGATFRSSVRYSILKSKMDQSKLKNMELSA